jgi:hypothetical protein
LPVLEPLDPDEQAASESDTAAAPAIAAMMRDFFTNELLCFFPRRFPPSVDSTVKRLT